MHLSGFIALFSDYPLMDMEWPKPNRPLTIPKLTSPTAQPEPVEGPEAWRYGSVG
ncbi:hypothetical protein NTCA1_16800 [Novosphingobium sp. TCA1]|nr:hypothetical protein NTCA1_16800 [Novosphingobium sp. TCA1]